MDRGEEWTEAHVHVHVWTLEDMYNMTDIVDLNPECSSFFFGKESYTCTCDEESVS